jgi:exodeoxyribonuclease III
LKIATWNVNGIRAILGKSALQNWLAEQSPDILCLQEIKARPEQLSEAQMRATDAYSHVVWNPAQRPGYSGVSTWMKAAPEQVMLGLGVEEFDAEGRVILTRQPGFLLFNIYFPNGQRGHDRVEFKLAFYAKLLEMCNALHAAGENIIITGDFNTAHRDMDLANPRENETTSGFLPEERAVIDEYLQHGFVDAYRTLYPEKVQYTWWTYRFAARRRNIGWRIDYFLVSQALMPRVRAVTVFDTTEGSDHCPVLLEMAD